MNEAGATWLKILLLVGGLVWFGHKLYNNWEVGEKNHFGLELNKCKYAKNLIILRQSVTN